MSDARWLDVADDVAEAVEHFGNAQALLEGDRFDDPGLEGYRNRMALMHALQSAHTSAENALQRILRILGEDLPTGENWHQTLINRLAKAVSGSYARPALLSKEVAADLQETRRFRNRAMRSYGSFDIDKSRPSFEAGKRLASTFPDAIRRFKAVIDPDDDERSGTSQPEL